MLYFTYAQVVSETNTCLSAVAYITVLVEVAICVSRMVECRKYTVAVVINGAFNFRNNVFNA
jgi:hypothetical protein